MNGGSAGARIVAAIVIAGLFAGLAWADATGLGGAAPVWWLLPVVLVIGIGGVDEFVRLCAARGLLLPAWLVRGAVIAIPFAAACGAQAFSAAGPVARPTAALGWSAACLAFALLVVFANELAGYRPEGRALERLAASTFIVAYLGLPLAFMVGLRLLCVENLGPEQTGPGHLGILPLVSLVAVVKGGDIAAYVAGTLAGRHKMAPILSPGKTWEGAAASVVGSLAAAWLVLEHFGTGTTARPWGGWPVYGLAVGVAGMVGDLAESLLKREAGAKDSGGVLGALGGVLDLVDSLLAAAPVAWMLWVVGR